VEEILHQAEQLEKEYDWSGAAESYEKALNLVPQTDFSKRGEIHERLGYALYRAAFQAGGNDEFKAKMRQAVAAYEKANRCNERLNEPVKTPKTLHCNAMIVYMDYWLASESSEKKKLLDECWKIEKETIKACDENGDRAGAGKASIELANLLSDRLDLELDTHVREKIADEALSAGEKAIRIFSDSGSEHELAGAYCITSINCYDAAMSLQPEAKRRECEKKAFDYAKEAIRISEKCGDKVFLSRSFVWLGFDWLDLGAGSETASEHFEKALQHGIETKDHRLLAEVFDGLAYSAGWMSTVEDLDKIRQMSRKCDKYCSEAISHSVLVDYGRGTPHAIMNVTIMALTLARREIEPEARHEMAEKAVTLGREGLERAQRTGSTHVIFHALEGLGQALHQLSITKTGVEKTQLLQETMAVGEEELNYAKQIRSGFLYVQAEPYWALASALFELANLEESPEEKKKLLKNSISRMETCIALMQQHLASFAVRRELFAVLARAQTELGNILAQMYETGKEKDVLRKQVEAYQSAVEMNSKANLVSRVAEAYWHMAVTHDRLGEYLQSALSFEYAFKKYEQSAQNIPQLGNFYRNYAKYMQAWSAVEKARHHHGRQEYSSAKEHFEKAAELHESLKQWNYLEPNYLAWAQIENAEELSRKEQGDNAVKAFEQAANLFEESKISLQAQLGKIEDQDEKQMAKNMLKATDIRREYCQARIMIEEAKILDKKGDHYLSSEKYGSATRMFEKIGQALESEQERREIKFITSLSQAWQKMMLADAKASPELYLEASMLFEQVSKESNTEAMGLLALGNSRFCKALEEGTKFADTGDSQLHKAAVQHLESAAKYYVKAGFQSASEYAKATGLLFDAYVHMNNAKEEKDPENKTRLYAIAEKVLQTSAGSFMKAEHPEKREQVLRLLEKVREERELAMSIAEVLHTPSMVSTTTSFAAPAPSGESAVGSARFESADIQANLIVQQRELKIGENLKIEIELVNAGRSPAVLIKLSDIIPEGFELIDKPEIYRVEDGYLNMKGKRLDALKPEEIKITLKPKSQGIFQLKPRISYLDENGKYRSYEPESVSITVKELGIKGWLKGER
jgi:tetratricopeptide (TPR) repeat protein